MLNRSPWKVHHSLPRYAHSLRNNISPRRIIEIRSGVDQRSPYVSNTRKKEEKILLSRHPFEKGKDGTLAFSAILTRIWLPAFCGFLYDRDSSIRCTRICLFLVSHLLLFADDERRFFIEIWNTAGRSESKGAHQEDLDSPFEVFRDVHWSDFGNLYAALN